MLLHLSTWSEIESYLARSKGIVVPIGSTEQHGPNGLLGTDALCPEIIAHHAAAARDDILVAPAFNVGQAQHHMAFPGTITLRPSTMIAAMLDWTASLTRHGFERIYWFNGHGGNIATIGAAFSEIYAQASLSPAGHHRPAVRCALRSWWDLPEAATVSKELFPVGEGSHATPSEVSITYYGYPQAVKQAEMSPKVTPAGPILDAEDYRRRFPDGRIGSDPSQASIEAGRRIVAAAAEGMLRDYQAFLTAS